MLYHLLALCYLSDPNNISLILYKISDASGTYFLLLLFLRHKNVNCKFIEANQNLISFFTILKTVGINIMRLVLFSVINLGIINK